MQPAPTLRRLRRSHSATLGPPYPGRSLGHRALADPFEINLRAISKPLKMSERAGLIAQRREGAMAACQPSADWVEPYRHFWEESFDRLRRLFARTPISTSSSPSKKTSHLSETVEPAEGAVNA